MLTMWDSRIVGMAVALAMGLLIGLDRERHKNAGASPNTAGVRAFSLVALIGAISALVGSPSLIIVLGAGVVILIALSYRANLKQYPGLTTEFALLATFAVGFLAMSDVRLAAALGVFLTLLVSSKTRLHRFAIGQLSERELHDGTLLAGAALIVWPLLPNTTVDPFAVINLRVVWGLTLLMLTINALGYVAHRAFGAQVGLAVAGFCGGFVSSILTIAAMGRQAKRQPSLLSGAVAGASFSSIATAIELLIIVVIINRALLPYLAPGIVVMGAIAALYGVIFQLLTRSKESADAVLGRAFEPKNALLFAGAFALMLLLAALLQQSMGQPAAQLSIALGGFLDAHAATASAARLAFAGTLRARPAAFAVQLAISTNIAAKMAVALVSGGRPYALRLWPSHLVMLAGVWLSWLLVPP